MDPGYQGGGSSGTGAVPPGAVPTFPRTVPRTISVPRGNDHAAGFDNANVRMSVVGDRAASPQQAGQPPSSSSSSAHWQQQQQQPINGDVTSPFVNSTTPGERYANLRFHVQSFLLGIVQGFLKVFLNS